MGLPTTSSSLTTPNNKCDEYSSKSDHVVFFIEGNLRSSIIEPRKYSLLEVVGTFNSPLPLSMLTLVDMLLLFYVMLPRLCVLLNCLMEG